MKTVNAVLAFFIFQGMINGQKIPQLGKDPVSRVVAAMTLEEKASLVVGTGMRIPGMPSNMLPGSNDAGQKDPVPGASGATFAIPRLGIPSIIVADGPAGLRISPSRDNDDRTYYCTAFPIATLLASTWDQELVKSVGEAMGNEVLEYGVDIILGPGLNIHRNPLGGRNFEYYSEDPLITGVMAAAMISGIQSQGVGTSPKHFAANNAETNRNALNTIVSERALREIYLKGFRLAVGAQPWTIMSSYNLINGLYAPENPGLLTDVLRNEWNFGGFVMTDWFGGTDPVAMMKAGNDLLMPGMPNQKEIIIKAVQEGSLDEAVLDRNAGNILGIVLKSPKFKDYKYSNNPDLKAHAELTRRAGSEGMILLKNSNSALPLSGGTKKVALFGNSSYTLFSGGTGSGDVNEAYTVSLADGMTNAGYNVSEGLHKLYSGYLELAHIGRPAPKGIMAFMPQQPVDELVINMDVIKGVAATTEAAIITIGRNSGEGLDRQNIKGDFLLTDYEYQLIRDVSEIYRAAGKKVIVVLNIGGVIETASWKDYPDAIVCAWQAGQEAGNSIADIISGNVNPSGKLATTFPILYTDVASSKTFPGKELPGNNPPPNSPVSAFQRIVPSVVYYDDGIYVGYRYFQAFNVKPSFEFGFGLSYTTFDYSNLRLSSPAFRKTLTANIDITNTGRVAGKESVQLYIVAPGNGSDSLAELKGFAKSKLLQPGETQTLFFTLDPMSIASFDHVSSSWKAVSGRYLVRAGSSSADTRMETAFTVQSDIVVQKVSKVLVPNEKIDEIRPE